LKFAEQLLEKEKADALVVIAASILHDIGIHKAEEKYKKVIGINPNHAEAYNNIGVLMFISKKYEEAEKKYKKALDININYIDAHSNLGNLYYIQKEYNKALNEFEIILKLTPNDQSILEKVEILKQLIKG